MPDGDAMASEDEVAHGDHPMSSKEFAVGARSGAYLVSASVQFSEATTEHVSVEL